MKNNKNRRIIGLLLLAIATTSCSEDFIDKTDPNRLPTSTYINDSESLKTGVIATYGTLMPLYNNPQTGVQVFDVASDNASTVTSGGIGSGVIDQLTFNSAWPGFSTFWNATYKSIAECNIVLTRGPKISMDATLQNRLLAETKFIRALNYFNLVRIFGDVPLVTVELHDYKEAYAYGRQPVATVYTQIVKDLSEAATALPAVYTGGDIGRVTSGAAKALLGKVYLTQGKYSEALASLTEVINSANYALVPDFNNVFGPANETNSEMIFTVRYLKGGFGMNNNIGASMNTVSGNYFGMSDWGSLYTASDKRKAISGTAATGTTGGTVYLCKKFVDPAPAGGEYDNDWIVLRYADVLLMQAECLNELNRTNEAFVFINQIRQRAGLANLAGLNQADFRLAVENERRLELGLEGHRWFDLVRTGRALTVMNAHFAANVTYFGGTTLVMKPTHVLFPIPLVEIQSNPDKLTQNPGY